MIHPLSFSERRMELEDMSREELLDRLRLYQELVEALADEHCTLSQLEGRIEGRNRRMKMSGRASPPLLTQGATDLLYGLLA